MRILFLSEGLDRPEAHTIAGLHQAGLDTLVMLPADARFVSFLKEHGVTTIPLQYRGRFDLAAIRAIRRAVKRSGCDVVHALRNNRPVANALFAVRDLRVKLVCYRGTMGNLHPWDPGSRLTYLNSRLDRIVCVSNAVRAYLESLRISPSKLITIYKGHDPSWYHQPEKANLAPLGIPPGSVVVGCAANMRPLKGVDVLVRALEHLDGEPPVHLLLIGEVRDPALGPLLQEPRFRGRVTSLGYRTDATTLLGACDIAVMPSLRREGLPRAIIEAMSQSLPCIVTRVGGMPELVEDGGNGYVVEPGDSIALAEAIRTLAVDAGLRSTLGARSLERVQTHFSVVSTIAATRRMYEELLG